MNAAATRHELGLHEEAFLLALRPKEGTVHWKADDYQLVLGGAIIAELLLRGRVRIEAARSWLLGERKLLHVADASPTGDPVLDACLELVKNAKKPKDLQCWSHDFACSRNLKGRVAEGLCAKGVLKPETRTLFWFFSQAIHPEIDPAPRERLLDRLKYAIYSERRQVEERTAALIALLQGSGILRVQFESKVLRERRQRIKEIAGGSSVSQPVAEAIAQARAAMMMVVCG